MAKEKSNLALIITTRWRSEILAQAIDSALKNAVFDNEIIIVADCPTWQTLKVIQERKLKHYTVHFAHCDMSRSFGAWKTQSEYVGFSDDDVYYGPRWDEALMEIMRPNIVASVKRYQLNEDVSCGFDGKDWRTFKPELLDKEIEKNKYRKPDEAGYGQPITHHRKTYFKYHGYTFHTGQGQGHEGFVKFRMREVDPNTKALRTYKSGIFHWGHGGNFDDSGLYASEVSYGLKLCLGCGKAEFNNPNEYEAFVHSEESRTVYRRGYYLCPDCLAAGRKDIGKFRLWDFWSKEN